MLELYVNKYTWAHTKCAKVHKPERCELEVGEEWSVETSSEGLQETSGILHEAGLRHKTLPSLWPLTCHVTPAQNSQIHTLCAHSLLTCASQGPHCSQSPTPEYPSQLEASENIDCTETCAHTAMIRCTYQLMTPVCAQCVPSGKYNPQLWEVSTAKVCSRPD